MLNVDNVNEWCLHEGVFFGCVSRWEKYNKLLITTLMLMHMKEESEESVGPTGNCKRIIGSWSKLERKQRWRLRTFRVYFQFHPIRTAQSNKRYYHDKPSRILLMATSQTSLLYHSADELITTWCDHMSTCQNGLIIQPTIEKFNK